MGHEDVTGLQEGPWMDKLQDLAVVSPFRLYCPFHIPCQVLGDLRGFLLPPCLISYLSHKWMVSSLEGRNHLFVLSSNWPPHSTPNTDQHRVLLSSDALNVSERVKPWNVIPPWALFPGLMVCAMVVLPEHLRILLVLPGGSRIWAK